METAADLIFEKRSKVCEVAAILFEYCNFSCEFCPQNHEDIVGMSYEEIVSKADPMINYINTNKYAAAFVVRFMGGELFADEVVSKPRILEAYRHLAEKIRKESHLENRPLRFMWISNFSMKSGRQDVLDFIESQKQDSMFIVSYDPKGRFNKSQKETFKENIEIFKKHIISVTTVMTKQNIEVLMAGDEYYDYLYDNFECALDKYVTRNAYADFSIPKESLVLEFYKLLVDKYPEIEFIDPFVKKPEIGSTNPALCSRGNGFALDPTNEVVFEGCVGTHYLKKKNIPVIANQTKKEFLDKSIEHFLEKYNCHACEYYQRCPMTCFTSLKAGSIIEDLDTCINKLLFKYVDSKK